MSSVSAGAASTSGRGCKCTKYSDGGDSTGGYNQRLPSDNVTGVGRNRVRNPRTRGKTFGVRAGAPLLDGNGRVRGVLSPRAVRQGVQLNFGQRKLMPPPEGSGVADAAIPYLYAFATSVQPVAEVAHGALTGWRGEGPSWAVSGWIPEAALTQLRFRAVRDRLRCAAHCVEKRQKKPQRVATLRKRTYVIRTEAEVRALFGSEAGSAGRYHAWKYLRVAISGDGTPDVADYLPRTEDAASPGGYVNLCYALPGHGGVANDTFPAGTTFRRILGVKKVSVDLYKRLEGRWRPSKYKLTFVYGYVLYPRHRSEARVLRGHRYGWFALRSLKPVP